FVTGVFLTLDVGTGQVLFANAGHCAPFVRRRDGQVERIEGGHSTAIGFFRDTAFAEEELTLAPGDALVLYTDGIIEAANAGGEMLGGQRLEECLAGADGDAAAISARVLGELRDHIALAPQGDDVTMIVCSLRATGR